jgi:anhydro-N-acetylmuramic acid kinase
MNSNLESLYKIAKKPSRTILGLMSGTSMDGLDLALCEISGSGESTEVKLLNFDTIEYNSEIKTEILKVFAKKNIDFQHLVLLNEWIGTLNAEMINQCLKSWNIPNNEVDIIASHGQTVFHAPKILHQIDKFSNGTLQIGDGDHIAVKTGIITISDFRQKHVAAGGEGAPLAVYGDYFVFGKKGKNRIMLNIGGIANFTYLPSNRNPNEVFVTDTGAGNTLIDAFTRLNFPEKSFDKDAEIASKGAINQYLLKKLKANNFFKSPFPKTTGPELFSIDYVKKAQQESNTLNISIHDLLATLTRFSAETIAEAINFILKKEGNNLEEFTIYLSGGGMHNPLLANWLKDLLPCKFLTTDEIGISGDAKEAVLFAVIANETIAGGKSDFGSCQGVPSVSLGKISFPN